MEAQHRCYIHIIIVEIETTRKSIVEETDFLNVFHDCFLQIPYSNSKQDDKKIVVWGEERW